MHLTIIDYLPNRRFRAYKRVTVLQIGIVCIVKFDIQMTRNIKIKVFLACCLLNAYWQVRVIVLPSIDRLETTRLSRPAGGRVGKTVANQPIRFLVQSLTRFLFQLCLIMWNVEEIGWGVKGCRPDLSGSPSGPVVGSWEHSYEIVHKSRDSAIWATV